MEYFPQLFEQLLGCFAATIGSAPTVNSFVTVVLGWCLCNGRHTVTGVIRAAGPLGTKSHDAYQNFFSKSKWNMDDLWKVLFRLLVTAFCHGEQSGVPRIWIAGDDTLTKHYGRKIWGAGLYRDAVRSSRKHTAYAWGLNWVVLAMIVKVPLLNDRFIALPILVRLNPKTAQGKKKTPGNKNKGKKGKRSKAKGRGSKRKKTCVTIMAQMVETVAGWMPDAEFLFCGDGAYACLVRNLPENVELVSRMRSDARIYALPGPQPKGKRGPKPRKGKRLPAPRDMAKRVRKWKTYTLELYGETVEHQLHAFTALWYDVCPDKPLKIVIVRDPSGEHDDEFFFTTDIEMSVEEIILCYTGRWAIEVVFRESKQYLGMGDAQVRKEQAVLRVTPFCLWLNSLIKLWFITATRRKLPVMVENDPWYTHKDTISFQDMLGALRLHFWRGFISTRSTSQHDLVEIMDFIIKSLAKAA